MEHSQTILDNVNQILHSKIEYPTGTYHYVSQVVDYDIVNNFLMYYFVTEMNQLLNINIKNKSNVLYFIISIINDYYHHFMEKDLMIENRDLYEFAVKCTFEFGDTQYEKAFEMELAVDKENKENKENKEMKEEQHEVKEEQEALDLDIQDEEDMEQMYEKD